MFDPLYYFEKAAKAVRGGILAASDNLAFLVSDACRNPDSAAGSPENAAVVAPSPKQGSDSPPTDCSIPPAARRGAPQHLELAKTLRAEAQLAYVEGYRRRWRVMADAADVLDPPQK
jgi:hypothetical protein